jgi:hypothetical protein
MVGSFFFLLYFTRFKWGSLYMDTYSQLWFAENLLAGKKLYADVFSNGGFFPPYVLAFMCLIFGSGTYTEAALGALTLAVTAIFLFRLASFFTGIYTSTLLVIAFFFVQAFGAYHYTQIFNFILPCTFNATFFMMFSTAALVFFIDAIESGKNRSAYLAGAALSMAFASRVEMTVPVWGVFVAVGGLLAYKKRRYAPLLAATSSILAALAAYLLFLSWAGAFKEFKQSVIGSIVMSIHGDFSAREAMLSGLDDFWSNTGHVAKSFVVQSVLAALIYATAAASTRFFGKKQTRMYCALPYAISALAATAAGVLSVRILGVYNQYRLMTIVLLWMTGYYLYGILRQESVRILDAPSAPHFNAAAEPHFNAASEPHFDAVAAPHFDAVAAPHFDAVAAPPPALVGNFSRLALYGIALAVAMRIILKISAVEYGFYILTPSIVCYFLFFTEYLPSLVNRHFAGRSSDTDANAGGATLRVYTAAFCVFFTVIALPLVSISYRVYGQKSVAVDTGRGRIFAYNDEESRMFWSVVDYVNEHTPQDAKVVVLPEGLSVNYFTGRKNPLKYPLINPLNLKLIGEDEYIGELQKAGVSYIIHFKFIGVGDFGYKGFGVDYGTKINDWIMANYRPVLRIKDDRKDYVVIYGPKDR